MPKPSPTTEPCSRYFETFFASFPYGCGSVSPKTSPIANASGGDTNPLALASRHNMKIILGIIFEASGSKHQDRNIGVERIIRTDASAGQAQSSPKNERMQDK